MPAPTTIAIDGPAASGKSTIGCELAKRLDYLYFDTGVMYRAVTWAALDKGICIPDEAGVTALAQRLSIDVRPPTIDDGRQYTVLADGQDITWSIREDDVESGVSLVSAYRGVRQALVSQQRRVSDQGRVVMVGRDIGTIVLPNAKLKIFLNASIDERAKRRYRELIARGQQPNYKDLVVAMRRRDEIDSKREVSPLVPAADAVIVDTSHLTIDQVLDAIEDLANQRVS